MSEIPSLIEALIIDDPRKETAFSGFMFLLAAGVVALILGSLLNLSLGVSWIPFQMLGPPAAWLPEIISTLLLIGFSAASIFVSIFVRRAIPFHLVRTWGVLALGVLLLVAAIRLLAAVGGSTVTVILVASMVIDVFLQATRVRATKERLFELFQQGSLEHFLSTNDWTWSGALYSDVKSAIFNGKHNNGSSALQRLHWFAPAIGILFARIFGAPLSALLVGTLFMIGAVVLFRRSLEEMGTLLFLKTVEVKSERKLLLAWAKSAQTP